MDFDLILPGLRHAGEMARLWRWGLLTGLAALGPLARGSVVAHQTGHGWEVRDAWERKVVLPAAPRRIVSLSPAVTSLIFELGLQDRLAGVTRYCRLPPDHAGLPRLGGGDAPLEGLMAVKPDLVLAGTVLPESEVRRLESLPLPVVVFRQQTFEDIFEDATALAAFLEAGAEARARIGDARGRLEAIRKDRPSRGGKALLLFSDQGDIWTSGAGSYGDEAMRLLGLENVAAGMAPPWTRLSREFVLQEQPAILVFSSPVPDGQAERELARLRENWRKDAYWSKLPAVRDGRIVLVPDNRLEIPSLRMVEAVEWIRQKLEESGRLKP
jgi:iron complex transport system substrate-binding protein